MGFVCLAAAPWQTPRKTPPSLMATSTLLCMTPVPYDSTLHNDDLTILPGGSCAECSPLSDPTTKCSLLQISGLALQLLTFLRDDVLHDAASSFVYITFVFWTCDGNFSGRLTELL